MYISRRRVYAGDEIDERVTDVIDEGGDVQIDPEATDLLFEAEDVAELVAEVTGDTVEVAVDDDSVTFSVGNEDFTVEPEGDEEILESVRKPLRGKRRVSASTRRRSRVAASRQVSSRTSRRVSKRR